MYEVCSFCGEGPVIAWFEGPDFCSAVDAADKVRAKEAWLACSVCLDLVEADEREGLVERGLERLRRRDEGRERTLSALAGMPNATQGHLARLFWQPRSE